MYTTYDRLADLIIIAIIWVPALIYMLRLGRRSEDLRRREERSRWMNAAHAARRRR